MKFCWHKWEPKPMPEGWVIREAMYRRCRKCGRWEAKCPPHWNANFWQEIEVPFRFFKRTDESMMREPK